MKLTVKNLGAIKEGSIDLNKKVYLFVGYNNSGKTYMSKLIFKIFRKETINGFLKSEEYLNLAKNIHFSIDKSIELDEKLVNIILRFFASYLEKNIDFANPTINFTFSSDSQKEHFFNTKLKQTIGIGFGNGNSYDVYTFFKEENSKNIKFIDNEFFKNLPFDIYEEYPKKKIEETYLNRIKESELKEDLVTLLLKALFDSRNLTSYFFAADRIFYLKNNDWAANKKVQQLNEIREKLREKHKKENLFLPEELLLLSEQNYTEAEDVLLTEIYKLEQAIKNGDEESNTAYEYLLSKFNAILGGRIVHELVVLGAIKAVRWKFLFEDLNKKEMKLELPKVSSAVNQLSTLALYLQYFAKEKQNFLFIDEPEENLHPKNQIQLLNLLLEFASINENRLLLTTHSPLLAEHLNNYLGVAYLKDKQMNSKQSEIMNVNVKLKLEDIGVYFFGNQRIMPYDFEEYGVVFSDFNQVLRATQEANSEITDQIYHLKIQD
ncbi:MAG: AAA family ATPase [Thermoflexibacteraceae bacterium]|jgi:ABC-type multidrug transport system ATPase subunit